MKNVLLVDDQQSILKTVQKILLKLQYNVFTANSAEEALEIYDKQKIDLVLSDYNMLGQTGLELYHKLLEKKFLGQFILMSGFIEEDLRHKLLNEKSIRFLAKPFTLSELKQILDLIV